MGDAFIATIKGMEHTDESNCPFCNSADILLLEDEGVHFALCLDCRSSGPLAPSPEQAHVLWCDRPLSDEPEYITEFRLSKTTH